MIAVFDGASQAGFAGRMGPANLQRRSKSFFCFQDQPPPTRRKSWDTDNIKKPKNISFLTLQSFSVHAEYETLFGWFKGSNVKLSQHKKVCTFILEATDSLGTSRSPPECHH